MNNYQNYRNYSRPRAHVEAFMRRIVLHPVSFLLFFVASIYFSIFDPAGSYSHLSFFWRLVNNVGWMLVYFMACVLLVPKITGYCLSHGKPPFWGYAPLMLVLCTAEYTIGTITAGIERDVVSLSGAILGTWTLCVMVYAFGMLIFRHPMEREMFSVVPDGWLWRPWLEGHSDEKILRLVAQNQYTLIVTSKNSMTVSKSLKQMVEQVPPAIGLRVHRSYWVAKSEIVELRYIDGNPYILIRCGEIIPISRKIVPNIKSHLLSKKELRSLLKKN